MTQPTCTGCAQLAEPNRTIDNAYEAGRLTSVNDYADSITYHPNGMARMIEHAHVEPQLDGPVLDQSLGNGMSRAINH